MPIFPQLSVQESPTEQIVANNLILVGLHLLDVPLRRRLVLVEWRPFCTGRGLTIDAEQAAAHPFGARSRQEECPTSTELRAIFSIRLQRIESHSGHDDSRHEREDTYARVLGVQVLHDADKGQLGCRVARHARKHGGDGARREADDSAGAVRLGEKVVRHQVCTQHVDLEIIEEFGGIDAANGARLQTTRAVDEHIDLADSLVGCREERRDRGFVSDISRLREDFSAGRGEAPESSGDALNDIDLPPGNHDAGSPRGDPRLGNGLYHLLVTRKD